jgi:hypothetical protein
LPAAVAGIGAIYGTYLVGTQLFERRSGLLAATMVALSQFHIDHSQEVRMYSLVACLTAWSFYWLLALRARGDRSRAAGYVLTTALLVYTHPYGLFTIVAQNLYVGGRFLREWVVSDTLAGFGRTTWRDWGRIQASLAVILVPYGLVALQKLVSTAAGSYTPLTWRSPPGPIRLLVTLVRYFGVPIVDLSVLLSVPLLLLAVAITVVRVDTVAGERLRDRVSVRLADGDGALLTLCWLLVPIGIPAVLSHLLSPVYGIRYTIGASLGLFVLVSRALSRLQPRHLRYGIILLLVSCMLLPLPWYYAEPQNEQWREATTHVAESADSGDLVLFTDADTRRAWDVYASRSDLVVREVSGDEGWRKLEPTAEQQTIWVLNRTYTATNHNLAGKVALADTHRVAAERQFVGVDLYRFERRENQTTSRSSVVIDPRSIALTETAADRRHGPATHHRP